MKNDTYTLVTERILDALREGLVPWRKPWRSIKGEVPTSIRGYEYRGINVWLLSLTAMAEGYTSPYWITFKQAKASAVEAARREGREIVEVTGKNGKPSYYEVIDGERVWFAGGVRKGEKGTTVVLWKPVAKKDADGESQGSFMLLRHYTVFNLDQCDGVEPPTAEEIALVEHDPIEAAETLFDSMPSRPEVKHGGDSAYYSPLLDYVQMPIRAAFDRIESYYATLAHELAHATGHGSRLGRQQALGNAFGSENYSREELVAEMASAFLLSEVGIEPNVEQSAAYVAGWMKAIGDDPKLVVMAAAQAAKAADWIAGRYESKGESA